MVGLEMSSGLQMPDPTAKDSLISNSPAIAET